MYLLFSTFADSSTLSVTIISMKNRIEEKTGQHTLTTSKGVDATALPKLAKTLDLQKKTN